MSWRSDSATWWPPKQGDQIVYWDLKGLPFVVEVLAIRSWNSVDIRHGTWVFGAGATDCDPWVPPPAGDLEEWLVYW